MPTAIPTAEEFDELRRILEPRDHAELVEQQASLLRRFELGESLAVAEFAPFKTACESVWLEQVKQAKSSAAFKWLDDQRGLGEAFKSMGRSDARRKIAELDAKDWSFDGRLAYFLHCPSRDEVLADLGPSFVESARNRGTLEGYVTAQQTMEFRTHMMKDLVTRFRRRVPYPYLRPIAQAFSFYFHTDRPAELRALRASLESVTASSEATIREMQKAAERHPDQSEDFRAASIAVIRSGRRLDRHYFGLQRDFQVAQRNDTHAKERMLVHDLYYGLRREGWRPGAAALCDFLTCEGVVHHLDTRTIERHLAHWKQLDADRKTAQEKKV